MLWHRQAIFKSKGDKLCFSAECRIGTRCPRHQIASRLNGWQTDSAIEDQAKNLNSTARPYDQLQPLDPHCQLTFAPGSGDIHICCCKCSGTGKRYSNQKETSCVPLQNANPGSQTPNRQQTECSLTNRLTNEDQAKNLNSTARPYDQRAFSPLDPTVSWLSHLALAIYIFVVVNFDALAQASDIQIERRQVVFLGRMLNWNPGSQTLNRQQTECSLTNRLSYRGSS